MEVKDAVKAAKEYVQIVFEDEKISEVGLEETDFDEKTGIWKITIGFKRPFKKGVTEKRIPSSLIGLPSVISELTKDKIYYQERWYKLLDVDDRTGKVTRMQDRILRSAA